MRVCVCVCVYVCAYMCIYMYVHTALFLSLSHTLTFSLSAKQSMPEVMKVLTKADASHQLLRLELRHNKISTLGASLLCSWMQYVSSITSYASLLLLMLPHKPAPNPKR